MLVTPALETAAAVTVGGTVRGPERAAAASAERGGAATTVARQPRARETGNPAPEPPHGGRKPRREKQRAEFALRGLTHSPILFVGSWA